MQYNQKHHIDVTARAAGAVIYNDAGELLLVQERQGSKKGLWHIPSGSMESGEFPADTATREIKEETGLTIHLTHYLNTYVGCFDDGDLVLRHVWLEKYPADQPLAPQLTDEIANLRFFSKADIAELYATNQLRMYHTKLMTDDAFRVLER
ncbi:NUDIX domain-containing protein [Reinekea sp. G2M2-21]|uniref:NUDIX domain-containing protein n=1 Tax=Reinekea sp. G2M2-21 TaxID=2788942 RepID=UPI0018AA9A53|nr:NUDIX domain-containing protein [Reinekea sp. G2M2-21]